MFEEILMSGDINDESYLAWWLKTYPTVESAEKELFLYENDYEAEYIQKEYAHSDENLIARDHDMYCLKRVIEIHKK